MEDITGNKLNVKWYFKTPALVIAFLCIGPFMLPLIWFNPGFNTKQKITISVAAILATALLTMVMAKSLVSIKEYYDLLKQSM